MLETEPLAVDVKTLAGMLSISPRHFENLDGTGKIGPMVIATFGRRKLYSVPELRAWAAAGFPIREVWQRRNEATD